MWILLYQGIICTSLTALPQTGDFREKPKDMKITKAFEAADLDFIKRIFKEQASKINEKLNSNMSENFQKSLAIISEEIFSTCCSNDTVKSSLPNMEMNLKSTINMDDNDDDNVSNITWPRFIEELFDKSDRPINDEIFNNQNGTNFESRLNIENEHEFGKNDIDEHIYGPLAMYEQDDTDIGVVIDQHGIVSMDMVQVKPICAQNEQFTFCSRCEAKCTEEPNVCLFNES